MIGAEICSVGERGSSPPVEERNGDVAFIVGCVFFIVVLGLIDARLPWPRIPGRGRRP